MNPIYDIIDAFDRFWDENADKIVPIIGVIALILYIMLVAYLFIILVEVFIECVPSNATTLGTVCKFRVK